MAGIAMIVAALGNLIYSLAAARWILPKMFGGRRMARREMMSLIPVGVRRIGRISFIVFFVSLAIAVILSLWNHRTP